MASRTMWVMTCALLSLSRAANADAPASVATMESVAKDSVRLQPCGEFVGTGGQWKMFGHMTFGDGNFVVADVDGIVATWPYFIAGDKVMLRTDKAYFTLRIEARDRLRGLDEWTKGFVYRLKKLPAKNCRKPSADAVGLEFCHFTGVMLKAKAQHEEALQNFRVCCSRKHADSCNQQGLLVDLIKHDEPAATQLYQRACDAGSGGGCGNLARKARDRGDKGEAKRLYQKACTLGHKDSCVELIDLD